MKIYRLSNPNDYMFAEASRIGTWSENQKVQERIKPLIVEWEPGSDVIGDFTWPGFDSDVVVKDLVGQDLLKAFNGFELSSVEVSTRKK